MHYLRYVISFMKCCDRMNIHSAKLPDGHQWNIISFILLIKYYSCDQIMKKEMGGACGTYGRQEICVQAFGGDALGKESIGKN